MKKQAIIITGVVLVVLGTLIAEDPWMALMIAAVSVAAATVGSMVGLGGGMIVVPVLVTIGFPHQLAVGSSLVATMANAVGSSVTYAKQKRIEYSHALLLGVLSIPGSVVGAVVSDGADTRVFGMLLVAVLIVAAIYIMVRTKITARAESTKPRLHKRMDMLLSAGIGFSAGVASSFFGIGGGVVVVPALIIMMGMSMMRAAPTSMLALMITSVAGVVVHTMLGNTQLAIALLLSGGALLGGMLGAGISLRLGERYLRLIAIVVLTAVSIRLFIWFYSM